MPRSNNFPCYFYKCEHCTAVYALVSKEGVKVLQVCYEKEEKYEGCEHCVGELKELKGFSPGGIEYYKVSGSWNELSRHWKTNKQKWEAPKREWKTYKWD